MNHQNRPRDLLASDSQTIGDLATEVIAKAESLAVGEHPALITSVVADQRARANAKAEVLSRVGVVFRHKRDLDSAIMAYKQALLFDPNHYQALCNLGVALRYAGEDTACENCCRRTLEHYPNDPDVHVNLATCLLRQGKLAMGWREYEWRHQTANCAVRSFPRPQWKGEDLRGKTLFVHCEQGFGDSIMFSRLLRSEQLASTRLIFGCQRSLKSLFGQFGFLDSLVCEGEQIPAFDFHCPLMSLPYVLGIDLSNVPNSVPYLRAHPQLIDRWSSQIAEIAGNNLKVGLCWQGRTGFEDARSVPIELLKELTSHSKISWFCLQKGPHDSHTQGQLAKQGIHDFGEELDGDAGPFMDTAAIIQHMDLVISCDTSIAHLAGAMARPLWLLLPHAAEWRWLKDRTDSPWYPTAKLYRQKKTPGLAWRFACYFK